MTTQLNFFNQPPEIEVKGLGMVDAVKEVRSRAGFVASLKVGPRNSDYTLRVHWASGEVNLEKEVDDYIY